MPNWSNVCADFPALHQNVGSKPLVYLDNAATTQRPQAVIDSLDHFYRHDNANVHRGLHALSMRATDAYEGARARVARFLNAAAPEEVIFTRGTTESINLVAASWTTANLRPGDVILLTEMEHHSNLVPWQLAAKRTGATLRFVPITGDEGTLDLSQLDRLLTPEVKLFAFTHVSNTLGTINPAAELCAKARTLGIVTVVDGAQSIGHLPVDVRAIGCDFFAFSGHKMGGPTGIGGLYGRVTPCRGLEAVVGASPDPKNQGSEGGFGQLQAIPRKRWPVLLQAGGSTGHHHAAKPRLHVPTGRRSGHWATDRQWTLGTACT